MQNHSNKRNKFVDEVVKAIDNNDMINRKLANMMLVGLPGTGKTSLLDRILGRPMRIFYSSTGVSDTVVIVDIDPSSTFSAAYICDSNSWKVIDFDESLIGQLECSEVFIPQLPERRVSMELNVTNQPSSSQCPHHYDMVDFATTS